MIPVTKTDITTFSMYLSVGNKSIYSLYNAAGSFLKNVKYLPLNGEGFQVCIRFYQIDTTN